ncbi:MAG: ribosome-associated translation inhibitor RaiA [Fibrobacterales bacterium]
MNVQFTARHFHASQELQDNMTADVQALSQFYNNIIDAHVILEQHKSSRSAEITVNILNKTVVAKAEEENMGKAVEKVLERMQRQLKKENELLKSHKANPTADMVEG